MILLQSINYRRVLQTEKLARHCTIATNLAKAKLIKADIFELL